MFKTASLVYNPGSGKKQATELAGHFAAKWHERFPNQPLALEASRSAEHFAELSTANYRKENLLILMGGDGSYSIGLNALFNAVQNEQLIEPIALLPAGSGNSFLRDFHIGDFNTAQRHLFEALAERKKRQVDCGKFVFIRKGKQYTRYFLNIWSIGLVSDINLLALKLGKSYTAATLLQIPLHKPYKYAITADGKTRNFRANFLAICNSKYTGGSMMMAPMAETGDGKLDAIVSCIDNRLALMGLFPKIFSGKHVESRDITHFTFTKLSVPIERDTPVMIDGEMDYADSVQVEIMPKCWQLFA